MGSTDSVNCITTV